MRESSKLANGESQPANRVWAAIRVGSIGALYVLLVFGWAQKHGVLPTLLGLSAGVWLLATIACFAERRPFWRKLTFFGWASVGLFLNVTVDFLFAPI